MPTNEPEQSQLAIEECDSSQDQDAIVGILRRYNTQQAGQANYKRLDLMMRDGEGKIIAGLCGETRWGWLEVETLAVEEGYRHQQIGSRLLDAAEAEARKRHCHGVFLDTYTFQARDFYERKGYAVYGKLENFPNGYTKFYLWKELAPF
ncbi:MAG: GNAT family N-acetyltransferase [Candidatus Obscuribacterales bacterium]|jgi:GNAT superfamily N-acetyltransferase